MLKNILTAPGKTPRYLILPFYKERYVNDTRQRQSNNAWIKITEKQYWNKTSPLNRFRPAGVAWKKRGHIFYSTSTVVTQRVTKNCFKAI